MTDEPDKRQHVQELHIVHFQGTRFKATAKVIRHDDDDYKLDKMEI